MFALKPRKDTVVRSLLIAVILFNALIPGAVAAASPSGIDDACANTANFYTRSSSSWRTCDSNLGRCM